MHLILYLILCAIVGLIGRNRALGAWGFFLLSFLLTPFVGILIIALGSESKRLSQKE